MEVVVSVRSTLVDTAQLTNGKREASPGSEVSGEDPMLGIVKRPISDGSNNFADNEKRIAIEVVRSRARHHDRASHVERREDDGHDRPAELVNIKAERDAEMPSKAANRRNSLDRVEDAASFGFL